MTEPVSKNSFRQVAETNQQPRERRRRALLSVYDKEGIVPFAQGLVELGFEILSTGGTLKTLVEAGVPVTPVSEVTGFPEILGGRVKSLHPHIHGGILARRHLQADMDELAAHGIVPIDLVAVNLYPFKEVVARPGTTWDEALENIDIGGPAMVRAAAKNFPHVVVVVNPQRYPQVLAALRQDRLSWEERRLLAQEAFAHTAEYDRMIAAYLAEGPKGRPLSEVVEEGDFGYLPRPRIRLDEPEPVFPERLTLRLRRRGELRYGENPHQAAAFYVFEPREQAGGLARARQLQGKELSYNNINDANAALEMVRSFREPAVAAVKHTNPCGLAIGSTIAEAFGRARDADPVSIFGGIVACNRPVDGQAARLMADLFLEVILAPSFDAEALEILRPKKNLRLLEVPDVGLQETYWDVRGVRGGLLIQEADVLPSPVRKGRVVTEKAPTEQQWEDLEFAWKVVRHVKSNGIVVAAGGQTLGIGAGQMNRILPTRLALQQAGERARGAVLASEAFFPFPDVVEAAAEAGIAAIVQPGGSKRDEDSIAAANRAGIAMVFTGMRHFRH